MTRLQTDYLLFAAMRDDGVPVEVGQLRAFYRHSLLRRDRAAQSAEAVDLPDDDTAVAADPALRMAVAPVAARDVSVAFDLTTLIHLRPLSKHAVLAPAALERDLAAMTQSDDGLQRLALVQMALRRTASVVVFDPGHLRTLAILGAARIAAIPLPALPAPPAPQAGADAQGRAEVVILAHGGDRGAALSMERALRAAMPGAAIGVLDPADAAPNGQSRPAAAAGAIHLHIGAGGRMAEAGPHSWSHRIVDSFVRRCPVVHLPPAPGIGTLAAGRDPQVEHMRTGIVAATEAAAVAAVLRLAGDPALRDILDRNADRAVESFNCRVDDQLWGEAA